MNLKERIEAALRGVLDPDTKLDIMRMKLIRDLAFHQNGTVSLTFRPSSMDMTQLQTRRRHQP
jgi:metal-sulfur cluster biosynthetic enzyme